MSEFSGVFDQLADALKASGASPSVTLRHQRAARRHAAPRAQAHRPQPEPVVVASKAKRKKEIDRSRDHAVYAAPHRPNRPHLHSRPEDVPTERVATRQLLAIATAKDTGRTMRVITLAFGITVALGLGAVALFVGLH